MRTLADKKLREKKVEKKRIMITRHDLVASNEEVFHPIGP